jgi:hypothetical protein
MSTSFSNQHVGGKWSSEEDDDEIEGRGEIIIKQGKVGRRKQSTISSLSLSPLF